MAGREDIYDWYLPKQPSCPHCGTKLTSDGHNELGSDGILTHNAICRVCSLNFKILRVPLPAGMPDPEEYDPHEDWEVERIRPF